jgi:hypothetical protein
MGGGFFRDPAGICAVAAANVEHTFVRLEGEGRDDDFEESSGGFLHRELRVVLPESVVEMFAPELAVEKVELVVVAGDVRRGGC